MALKAPKIVCVLVVLALCMFGVWVWDDIEERYLSFPVARRRGYMETPSTPREESLLMPPSDAPHLRSHGELRCETVWGIPHTHSDRVDLWNVSAGRYTEQGCASRPSIRCRGRKLKALVIYILHARGSPHDTQSEMWNLNYFARFGIYGAAQSTKMFERVDYVFARIMPAGLHGAAAPSLCAEKGNIKLLWVSEGPCDLCAHHRVLMYLGGVQRVKKKYAYLVRLNAGTRGPFQALDGPAWIDALAMSGYDVWDAKMKPPAVMTGATVSMEHAIHVQSYFVGMHTSALGIVEPFLNRCSGNLMKCVFQGEIPAGAAFMQAGGWIHALSRNVTVRTVTPGVADYAALQRRHGPFRHRRHDPSLPNPLFTSIDVCAAMFVKHGGGDLKEIPEMVVAQASQLTLHQSQHRALAGEATFKALVASCPFVRL